MSRSSRRAAQCIAVFAFACRISSAGHPLLSEDTGTQGKGNYELELGYDWSQQAGDQNFLFQPQLSWGVSPTIDAIEIDGTRDFFAGAGAEGAVVRLYVDGTFVADATVVGGRWLVEGCAGGWRRAPPSRE